MKRKFLFIGLILCIMILLLPTAVMAANRVEIQEGWYYLRCMNNYLNIDAQGGAELRKLPQNEAFYVKTVGENKITLMMKDGRYLGLDGERKNGTRVKVVKEPYTWKYYEYSKEPDVFSLRPPEAFRLVVNASGEKNTDGTQVIVWTHADGILVDNPNHARFRFIPVDPNRVDPTGESWVIYKENGKAGFKDRSGKVMIKAQFDEAHKFSQGVAYVRSYEKNSYAFIDTTGKLLTPYKYMVPSFYVKDGLIKVGVDSHEVAKALVNGDGVESVRSDGKSTVVVMRSGKKMKYEPKYGYINTKGEEVIPPQFDWADDFHEGLAAVYQYQGQRDGLDTYKVGWINTSGKFVIPYKSFDRQFSEELHAFKDGMVRYFVTKTDDPNYIRASGGIMDKTGTVIIPHNMDEWVLPAPTFNFDWKDGVILYGTYKRINEKELPDKNGKYQWNYLSLYDYSGKLIKKLDGYSDAILLDRGYILALHQTFEDTINGEFRVHWTLFDRTGKAVIEKTQEGFIFLTQYPIGLDNGYIYFGDVLYKVPAEAAKPATTVSAFYGPPLTAR